MIQLEENLKKEILSKILENSDVDKVFLFGSRARGDAETASDLDIAIESGDDILYLKNILNEEVHTLLKIDIVHLNRANETLKKEILKEGILLYEKV